MNKLKKEYNLISKMDYLTQEYNNLYDYYSQKFIDKIKYRKVDPKYLVGKISDFEMMKHPKMTLAFVKSHPEIDWDRYFVSFYCVLNIEDIPNYKWCYGSLSRNKNLTYEIIKAYPDKPWVWKHVERIYPVEYLIKNPNKVTDWSTLTRRADIEIIQKHSELPWNWKIVSNKKPCMYFVATHTHLDWNWFALTRRTSFNNIIEYSYLPWAPGSIKAEPFLVREYFYGIERKFDRELNYYIYGEKEKKEPSEKGKVLFEIMEMGLDKIDPSMDLDWDLFDMAFSTMVNKKVKLNVEKKTIYANKIKKWWVKLFWDPLTKVGAKRLQRSFENEEYTVW